MNMKTTRKIKNTLAVLCCLALFSTGYTQSIDKAKLDLLFDRLLEKNKGMGSITIAKDGKILYSRSFGYGQITETLKKPLTQDSKFRIASVTKTYTAVMIFQLVEEGKLKLTDRLDQFFPQVPNASKITIAQILSHRSGIPDLTLMPAGDRSLKPMKRSLPQLPKENRYLNLTASTCTVTPAMCC